VRYLALGDSYTIGTGASSPALSWPALIAARLAEQSGGKVELTNPAINGFTTLDLIEDELPQVRRLKPDLVTILIGVNDLVRERTPADYRASLVRGRYWLGPALASAVPLITPKDRLVAANALMQSTANIGLLVGPAVSGIGIALIGAQNVLYVDAATFFVSALCLMPIRIAETLQPNLSGKGWTEDVASDLLAGFRFVFVEQKTVLLLMLTATLYSVGISAFVFLLPVFAKDVLVVDPIQLGWLWSALGVGMLIASFGLASIAQGDFPRRTHLMSVALAVGGLAVGTLEFLEAPLAVGAVIVVIGVSTAMFTPLVWSMLQEVTPAPLLGRVFTTFAMGGMAGSMAGMAGFGWATDMLGPRVSLGGISFILLVTAAAVGTLAWYRSQMDALPATEPGAFAPPTIVTGSRSTLALP